MPTTLLFIHGTGVRQQAFDAALDIIRGEAAAELPGVTVRPCFWGERFGVRFHHGGRSIPDYDTARGIVDAEPADYEVTLWARLLEDPYFELRLRLFADVGAAETGGPVPGSRALPGEELLADVEMLARESPSPIRLAPLQSRWQQTFDVALREVARDPQFGELLTGLANRDRASEQAVARALVASAMVAGAAAGLPAIDGDTRDLAMTQLAARLAKGERAAMLSRMIKPLAGMTTRWAMERRGRLSDTALEKPGDVLLYQSRGAAIRAYIREEIDRCCDRGADGDADTVFLYAHSLGGIMCVDLLAQEAIPVVKGLITVGSQAPFLYETGALVSLTPDEPLPTHFPPWLNVYDKADFLSYMAGRVFNRETIEDFEVISRQPFPEAHSAYFGNARLWRKIAAFVGSLT
jgi:hypothetical protein